MNGAIMPIVTEFHKLNPPDAAECLYQMAMKMVTDASDLQAAWQDPGAGKVWEILGTEIDKAATKAMNYWQTV